jgi:hypothetical protein
MSTPPNLRLGSCCAIRTPDKRGPVDLPAHHLVTHGCVVGMTGSGKTGLLTVMVEEALRAGVPVLMIDVKGDLPNLLLRFPQLTPEALVPWVEGHADPSDTRTPLERAAAHADSHAKGLLASDVTESAVENYVASTDVRVITPGSSAGELLHVLSSLERRSERWDSDPESARAALSAAVSLLLRLLGRDPDPAKSREHVLLSVLAERRLLDAQSADLSALLDDLAEPPIEQIGALELNEFIPKSERKTLAAALNTLLASPTFASWRQGATLDIGEWVAPKNGRTQAVIVSVAHLDDDERALVLGVLLEEVLSWVRTLPGSQRLRALLVFDEVYGYLPPHPANPPTKRPLVALMKQSRAFGVGVLIATQNPMDLDYRALSNAGLWCVGRLQTDADRERVLDGLGDTSGQEGGFTKSELANTVKKLAPRWFLMRDAHARGGMVLLKPRWAISLMLGPMTRTEIKRARELAEGRVDDKRAEDDAKTPTGQKQEHEQESPKEARS